MSVMGAMTGMGGGGGGPGPRHFRMRTRQPPGPSAMEIEDDTHPKMSSLYSVLLPPCYPGEPEGLRLARTEGFRECVDVTKACSSEAVREAGMGCVQQVKDFIEGWRYRDGDADEENVFVGTRAKAVGESDLLPLAIVDAGLQLGDRNSAVEHIKEGLELKRGGRCPRVVAVLRAQDCATVEAALKQIERQCHAKGGKRSRRPLFMDALEEWYTSCPSSKLSSRRSASSATTTPQTSASAPRPSLDKNEKEDEENLDEECEECEECEQEDEDEDEDEDGKDVRRRRRRRAADVDVDVDVDFDVDATSASRRAATARSSMAARQRNGPVVILLEDVEGFDKQVLRDLLNVLAQPPCKGRPSPTYTPFQRKKDEQGGTVARVGRTVPIALVAIASSRVGFPMDRLSPSAVRQLSPENFHFPSSLECVEVLYEKLFIQRRLPLWMGGRLVSWMKATFNDSHLSVGMLSRQVILAAFLHFNRPASYLCLQHCRSWLRRSSLANCPAEALNHMKYKLARDSKAMPIDRLEKCLTGVPPRLDHQQAANLIEQGLHREASRALRLWFFHKVWNALLKSLEERGTSLGELGAVDVTLGTPSLAAVKHRMEELGSSVRIVALLSSSKRSKRYFTELKEVSEAIAYLKHGEVKVLLRELLRALPSADQHVAPAASANQREAAEASANQGEAPAASANQREAPASPAAPACPERSSTPSANQRTAPLGQSEEGTDISATPPSGSTNQGQAGAVLASQSPADVPSLTAPHVIQSLDSTEASYLRRCAGRVLRLWAQAEREGWADADDSAIQWSRSTSYFHTLAAGGGPSAGGGGGGNSAGSRGNRLFSSALHQGSSGKAVSSVSPETGNETISPGKVGRPKNFAAAGTSGAPGSAGGSLGSSHRPRRPSGNPPLSVSISDSEAAGSTGPATGPDSTTLRRACLVRELQLLFLHLMGEARRVSLGPGMGSPPPLADHGLPAVLSEAYCCDEIHKETLEDSLSPLARANVDLGMMEGACKGSSSVILKRKNMSEDQPVLDICALYSSYRGHGKTLDRSDWFLDFRNEVVRHKSKLQQSPRPTAEVAATTTTTSSANSKGKEIKNTSSYRSRSSGGDARVVEKSSSAGGGAAAVEASRVILDEDGVIDPTGGAELLARFEHACDQLASMGYVRPLKRSKRLETEKGGEGKVVGPKGAVTRLVFSYTMEDGAL